MLFLIQHLRFFFFFFLLFLSGGSCGFGFFFHPLIYSKTSACSQTEPSEIGDLFQSWAAAGSFMSAKLHL